MHVYICFEYDGECSEIVAISSKEETAKKYCNKCNEAIKKRNEKRYCSLYKEREDAYYYEKHEVKS